MVPTLQDGDRLLVLNSLLDNDYQYGDIVVLRKETFLEEPIVKRVIATEGQTVDIDFATGTVYVDGELLEEDYINELTYRGGGDGVPPDGAGGLHLRHGRQPQPLQRQPRAATWARWTPAMSSARRCSCCSPGGGHEIGTGAERDFAPASGPHAGGVRKRMNIQWYPGHMTKTRRMIAEQIKNVDAVCEIVDARIPISSRNPDIDELTAGKPRLVVLNRVDQADPEATKPLGGLVPQPRAMRCWSPTPRAAPGTKQFAAAVRTLLADKLRAYAEKGQNRVVRVMILGVPNVGKSTFINQHRRPQDRQDRGPARRHPGQAVGAHRPGPGAAGHPRHPLAQVRGPERGAEPGLHRRGEGRDPGRGDLGLPPDGLSGRPTTRRR